MNRRNLLKTFLAAPAVIRSGVLMPIVPLVAPKWQLDHLDALADLIDKTWRQTRDVERSIIVTRHQYANDFRKAMGLPTMMLDRNGQPVRFQPGGSIVMVVA
jgi:hypothetical protein